MTKNDILAFLRTHKNYLNEKFGVEAIALFGSYARDEATEESDIDLLVTMKPSFTNFFRLQHYLEEKLGKPVDLGTKLRKYIADRTRDEMIHV